MATRAANKTAINQYINTEAVKGRKIDPVMDHQPALALVLDESFSLTDDTTDNVREGSSNLYHTDSRVDNRILEEARAGNSSSFAQGKLTNRPAPNKTEINDRLTAGANIVIEDDPDDNTKLRIRSTATGGGGGTQYDTPTIAGFQMTGQDPDDGDLAGDVQIEYHVTHPGNISGNLQTGVANGNLGIEVSTDGNAYSSITSAVSQNINKGLTMATLTLPMQAIAEGASVYYRLFAYDTQSPRNKIVSNAIQITRARAHERAYYGTQTSDDFSSYDTSTATGSADVQNTNYSFDFSFSVPNGMRLYIAVPSNRRPTMIVNTGFGQTNDINVFTRHDAEFTEGGQSYDVYEFLNQGRTSTYSYRVSR